MLTANSLVLISEKKRKRVDQLAVGDLVYIPMTDGFEKIEKITSWRCELEPSVHNLVYGPIKVYPDRLHVPPGHHEPVLVSPDQPMLVAIPKSSGAHIPVANYVAARTLLKHGAAEWAKVKNGFVTYFEIILQNEGFIDAGGLLLSLPGKAGSSESTSERIASGLRPATLTTIEMFPSLKSNE